MARVRLLLRKRGNRWTGSGLVGSLGEAAIFVGLLLLGACSLITLAVSRFVYIPWLSEQQLTTAVAIAVVVVLASSMLIGIGGLLGTSLRMTTSVERRSALVRKAPELRPKSGFYPPARDYPGLPRNEELANSPGVHLAFRLPQESQPTWSVVAAAMLCLMWGGLFTVFAVTFVSQWMTTGFLWYLVPVVAGLGYLALRATWFFLSRLADVLRVGPTYVEVSEVPFFPGGDYQVAIVQCGDMTLKSLNASLACEEVATFRQGTDVRVERRRVVEREILSLEHVRVLPRAPLIRKSQVACPRGCMHSFQSTSNLIEWAIHVRGRLTNGNQFERSFPLVIYPTPRKLHQNPRWNP